MTAMLRAEDEITEQFLDAVARGDVSMVSAMLGHTPSLINRTNQNGWTGLMLAARNGHLHLAELLLEQGADRRPQSRSSQTAYDLAHFWGHGHIAALLATHDPVALGNYFSAEPLERSAARRTDRAWLEDRRPDAIYLLFSLLRPLLARTQVPRYHGDQVPSVPQVQSRLCLFRYDDVRDLLLRPETLLVFLGVERSRSPPGPPGPLGPPAWFALDTDQDPADLLQRCREPGSFLPTTPSRDLLGLSEEEAGIVAQARAVLAWHSRYRYCPTCGSGTAVEDGGYKRTCLSSTCRSQKGVHNTCYPRVDPVVIMLVVHPDGNQCLLGRKKVFPAGMFSCLAGFIEPGETLEAAVRREVHEESGVRVGAVRYVSSQPWPLPSSLMIGCLAGATSTDIQVNEKEIEEARWFTRQQVTDSLFNGALAVLTMPPRQTIAHQLVKHWIGMTSNL